MEGSLLDTSEGGIEIGKNISALPVNMSKGFEDNRKEVIGKLYRLTIEKLLNAKKKVV